LYYRTIAPAPQAPSSTKKRPRILHQKYPGALGHNRQEMPPPQHSVFSFFFSIFFEKG
jgi:hypothetical protein